MQCHQRCTQEGKQLQTDLASAWAAGVGGRAGQFKRLLVSLVNLQLQHTYLEKNVYYSCS